MLLNVNAGNAIEFHGHGSTSSKGVAAHIGFGVAKSLKVEMRNKCFESGIDVVGLDLLWGSIAIKVGAEGSGCVACSLHDVSHSTSQCLDGTGGQPSAVMVDALSTLAILLV